jgi:hypothetical protein
MQSSNNTTGAQSGNPYGYTYTIGTGINVNAGNAVTTGAGTYGAININYDGEPVNILSLSEPKVSMLFERTGDDTFKTLFFGGDVTAEVQPEADITPIEMLRLTMLIHACSAGLDINPISFIKNNNLSRHFRFSVK